MQNEPAKQEAGNGANPEQAIQEKQPPQPAATPAAPPKPAASPETIKQRLFLADCVLVILLLGLAFLLGSFTVLVGDVWMRLATGRLIANGHYQFGVDPFSYVTNQEIWVNHSWLFDWLVFTIYDSLGGSAAIIVKAVLCVAVAWVLLQIRSRQQPLFTPLLVVTAAMVILSLRLYLRPEMFSYLFLAIELYLLMRSETGDQRQGVRGEGRGAREIDSRTAHPSSLTPRPWHLWLLPPLWVLWVNLDAWFILGPITVGLYLLGLIIARLTGQRPSIEPRRLAAVLGVGLLACLLNPHHYRAFVLPPELAYLVVWLPLPSWMIAGGEALASLKNTSPSAVRLTPPWGGPYSSTISGFLLYPYYFLAVGSFVLPFVRASNLEKWNWSRALVLLFFAVLSAFVDQFVPFFVVAAAPCITLNIQDFFRRLPWTPDLQTQTSGRALAALGLIVLMLLAWPGWLHSQVFSDRFLSGSEHRVCWDFDPDPSQKKTADRLRELHKSDQLRHVFNLSRDLPSYCAWFCADDKGLPLVKGLLDHRYALFAKSAADYGHTRQLLMNLSPQTHKIFAGAWHDFTKKYEVDYVVLSGFDTIPNLRNTVLKEIWPKDKEWAFLYGDGRTLIFAWNDPAKAGVGAKAGIELSQLAFGQVPEWQRPPKGGTTPPQGELGIADRFAVGTGVRPLAIDETNMYEFYRSNMQMEWERAQQLWIFGLWHAAVAGNQGVPVQFALPTDMMTLPALTIQFGQRRALVNQGPPSAMVLETRAGRRAVHDNPRDYVAQFCLRQACNLIGAQEDIWVKQTWSQAPQLHTFRQELRLIQALTVLHSMARLRPDNPGVHYELANIYKLMNYLDLAQEHLAKAFDMIDTVGMDPRQLLEQKKSMSDELIALQRALKKRGEDFDLRATGQNAIGKAALAFKQPYRTVDQNNRERIDQHMGLAKKALALLQSADMSKLSVNDKAAASLWQIELLLKTGEAGQVHELVRDPKTAAQLAGMLGAFFFEWQALAAAAVGDYALAEKALTPLLDKRAVTAVIIPYQVALTRQLALTNLTPFAALMGATYRYRDPQFAGNMQKLADWQLAAGLLALEAGDTDRAAVAFEQSQLLVGDSVNFPDLPVAEHYLRLIRSVAAENLPSNPKAGGKENED